MGVLARCEVRISEGVARSACVQAKSARLWPLYKLRQAKRRASQHGSHTTNVPTFPMPKGRHAELEQSGAAVTLNPSCLQNEVRDSNPRDHKVVRLIINQVP